MATLCNYTHHELHNTSGLQRQGHGVLFPFNPEFYDRASGLYGPGTIIAWNLLFVSLVINAVVPELTDKGPRRHNFWSGMSGELVTFVAYPMFAATDLLVHGIQLIGHENGGSALSCLLSRTMESREAQGITEHSQQPLDLADIPPDILSLGQRIVEVNGPLDVCYSYIPLLAFWAIITVNTGCPKRTMATVVLGAGTTYIVLLVFAFYCTLGTFRFSATIFFMEVTRLLWKVFGAALIPLDVLIGGGAIVGLLAWVVPGPWWEVGDWKRIFKAAFPGFVIGGGVLGWFSWCWFGPSRQKSLWRAGPGRCPFGTGPACCPHCV